ncbi:MAG: hypothetical protein OWU84_05050 [Firmicutes bacterium]|nr:hypothetical protein [Bacillota bacterium]
MIVAMAVTENEDVGGGWGRARQVAVADVGPDGSIRSWEVYSVHWDELHDSGGEGQHHARIARFLLDHQVQRVIAGHMGPGMRHMLEKMNIGVTVDVHGPARELASRYGRAS